MSYRAFFTVTVTDLTVGGNPIVQDDWNDMVESGGITAMAWLVERMGNVMLEFSGQWDINHSKTENGNKISGDIQSGKHLVEFVGYCGV